MAVWAALRALWQLLLGCLLVTACPQRQSSCGSSRGFPPAGPRKFAPVYVTGPAAVLSRLTFVAYLVVDRLSPFQRSEVTQYPIYPVPAGLHEKASAFNRTGRGIWKPYIVCKGYFAGVTRQKLTWAEIKCMRLCRGSLT